ncbi:MAG: peptidoglycan editing factor PgeF [Pararhodobacter sp.]|nr:peptidoglycan editing factor PgeF [Pararhodobacter sp.]
MTLEILTADTLSPVRHGFFTRRGGASSGVYAGLNCGGGSGDQSEIVSINRARVAEAMNAAPQLLMGVHQVHSADVVTVTTPDATLRDTRADALVTDRPGLVLTVLTADCMPVLLADIDAGVIGAVHAGWRGALDGVLGATLDAMEGLGADRTAITAVIGPCISQRAYEVGPEFLDAFVAEDPEHTRFFANGAGDRYLFDLPGFGLAQLRAAGIGHAEWTRHCTYGQPDLFYSYRRSVHEGAADYGRLIAAIRL